MRRIDKIILHCSATPAGKHMTLMRLEDGMLKEEVGEI